MARILFISTFPPQECGIATYTRALIRGIEDVHPEGVCHVAVPLEGNQAVLPFGKRTFLTFSGETAAEYRQVAEKINRSDYDAVWLQHEFGIFSGEWGRNVLELCRALRKPLITTLHTVIEEPPAPAREITRELVRLSVAVTVMVDVARTLLAKGYGIDSKKVVQVPHGVPDVPFRESASVKSSELKGRNVLSTFGLLSSGKGIEYAIEAMPAVVERFPNTTYFVLGATHPKVKQHEGETYRHKLMALAYELGVARNVEFVGRYLSLDQIVTYLQSTDVYLTPYIGRSQISSGTLAYALSCGKAMVSTPYLYAQEVMGDGRGRLAEFEDPGSIARGIIDLLAHPEERRRVERACYAYSRQMTWTAVGTRHVAMAMRAAAEQQNVFVAAAAALRSIAPVRQVARPVDAAIAGVSRAPMVS
jgi:glycosyltransferase involved in cell wall biosynthesis